MLYPFDALFKAVPAVLLAVWLINTNVQSKTIAVAGLVFCASGDILLALTFQDNFVFGLLAFLVAHLLFALYFLKFHDWHIQKLPVMGLGIISMLGAALFILPETSKMFWPVSAYMFVIVTMAIMAILAAKNNPALIVGVFMFMFSDLLIGVNRFVFAIPLEHLVIMLTYYSALYLIVTGIRKQFTAI